MKSAVYNEGQRVEPTGDLMPGPFPGMDPYLEAPHVWRGFHARFINAASDLLQPQAIAAGFFVDIDERIWLEEPERSVYPDLAAVQWSPKPPGTSATAVLEADEPVIVRAVAASEVREPFLQVFDQDGRRLVTQIELISPTNKSSAGREPYFQKRVELKEAGVNVVEIDLLRGGPHVVDLPERPLSSLQPWHYIVCASRAGSSDREAWPIGLRTRLPRVRIPLTPQVPDLVLDLQAALDRVYDAGPYRVRLLYGGEPNPPLIADDAAWARELLKTAGMSQL